jgi:hypothetical protein
MAKLGIFTGTSANDATGNTLAQGAVIINSNFSEIYTALGDGTNITNSLSSITVAGLSTFTSGPVLVGSGIQTGDSKLQVSGDTFITGSIGVGTTNPTSNLHVIGGGNFTGIVSALSFSGNSSSASYATTAGIATYATNAGTSTSVIGGIGSITQLQVTGISTFTNGPVLIGGGTSTGTIGQVLQVTGISSGVYIGGSVGIGTTNPTESLHVQGNLKVTGTITGEVSSTVATARTSTNVIGGIGSITQLQVTGLSTFTNGPVLVGRATTTGTANQALQVESGAYFNGSIGIGTTNPAEKLSVFGAVESLYDTIGEGGQFVLRGKPGTPIRWNIDNYSVGVTTNLFRIFKEDNSTAGAGGRVYVGITTIGEFIIGDGAGALFPTGTANQQFQVQSSAYIQNNLGIGITTPTSSLSVNGSTVIGTEILNMTGLSTTFTTVGSNTFTIPAGVTKISAVLIGGGGAGGGSGGGVGGNGGGGGGLVYINDYPVSPGQTLTVVVGGGGVAVSGNAGGDGGNSSITGIAAAFGGKGGAATANAPVSLGGSGSVESNVVNSGISTGGSSGNGTNTAGGGGGGSAGYSGNGGSGGSVGTPSGAGSGGGAGGGSEGNGDNGGNGGGGIGILGQGSSGESGGGGGSGGENGVIASSTTGSNGGNYGGGGGGADGNTGGEQSGGNGAQGVVRIIWSPSSKFSRLFPTNQVGNNINQ